MNQVLLHCLPAVEGNIVDIEIYLIHPSFVGFGILSVGLVGRHSSLMINQISSKQSMPLTSVRPALDLHQTVSSLWPFPVSLKHKASLVTFFCVRPKINGFCRMQCSCITSCKRAEENCTSLYSAKEALICSSLVEREWVVTSFEMVDKTHFISTITSEFVEITSRKNKNIT